MSARTSALSPVATLLTDPEAFFRERRESPSLRGPAAVVGLVALLDAVAAALQLRVTARLFASIGGGALVQVFQAAAFLAALAGPFVVWLLHAGVFHAISAVFDGQGEFRTTVALVGWGFVPAVFESVASLAVDVYRFEVRGVDVPADVTRESMRQFQRQIQTGPLVALLALLGVLFTLWSGLIWVVAVRHARDLSLRDAALTVALPVLVGVVLSAVSVLGAL